MLDDVTAGAEPEAGDWRLEVGCWMLGPFLTWFLFSDFGIPFSDSNSFSCFGFFSFKVFFPVFFQLLFFLPELLFDSSIAFLFSEFVEGGVVIFHFNVYYFTTVRMGHKYK